MPKHDAPRLSRQPPQRSHSDLEGMIWPEPTAFMLSHCGHGALGLTLRLKNRQKARLCLLDGNPILPDITSCDRYSRKRRTRRKAAI
jgi:hypothetical protein